MVESQKTRNLNELIILLGELGMLCATKGKVIYEMSDDLVTCVNMLNICYKIASFATYYFGRGYL